MDAQFLVAFEDWLFRYLSGSHEERFDDPNDAQVAIFSYVKTLKQVMIDMGVYIVSILDANTQISMLRERTQRKLRLTMQSRDVLQILIRWQRQSDGELRKQLEQAIGKLDELREDCAEQKRDIEALEDSVQVLEEDRDEIFDIGIRTRKKLGDLQARLTGQGIEDWVNTTEIETLRGQNAELRKEIGALKEKLGDKQIENNVLEEHFREWQSERARLLILIHTFRAEKGVLVDENSVLEDTVSAAGKGMDRMNGLKWEFLRCMGKA